MGRVLVVEDDDLLREVLKLTLGGLDCEVVEARTGGEALELVSRLRPDVVILDLILPDMDGLEVCRRLKEDQRVGDAYVIVLTARDRKVDKEEGLRAGADEYWVKPFSPTALLRRLEEVLSERKGRERR